MLRIHHYLQKYRVEISLIPCYNTSLHVLHHFGGLSGNYRNGKSGPHWVNFFGGVKSNILLKQGLKLYRI
jgi:hypothetical protein